MLIRSQDKTALVKFENIVVNLKLPDSLKVICWSWQDAQRSGGYFVLGEYSTKAKAMKVLDMIQEAYADFEATKCISTGLLAIPYSKRFICEEELDKTHTAIRECADMLKKAHIFQMPEDSEVEE